MEANNFFRQALTEEFSKRSAHNQSYSLRAFARSLKVDPGSLSKIFSSQMLPSWNMGQRLVVALGLDPRASDRFLASLATAHRARSTLRLNPKLREFGTATESAAKVLDAETFRIIADWYHYAILELTFTPNFSASPAWIAKRLDISVLNAKLAVERLQSSGLLTEKRGRLVKADSSLRTGERELTNAAFRRHQKQILEKAIVSLENDPVSERDTTALCMAIDPAKIPEAKKRIQNFKNELCNFLESGKRTQVYELSMSLFPIQRP